MVIKDINTIKLSKMFQPFLKKSVFLGSPINLIKISITKNTVNQVESKKLMLEFAIHNSDWSLARENVLGLIKNNPDREICELMALLELGEFSDKQKSDAWYLRAQNSNLNKIWVCQITNTSQSKWNSVSESGYFNSLEWKHPKMLGSNFNTT